MSGAAYARLLALLPADRSQIARVVSTDGSSAIVELPGGNRMHVRGTAVVGVNVFVRGGAIEGPAPTLTVVSVEI